MAIAFDTSTGTDGNTATLTFSHTCSSGANRILFVAAGSSSNHPVTGVTYASVAMTLIVTSSQSGAGGFQTSLWYLIAPATGANNVVISAPSSTRIAGSTGSYTGVLQTSPIDSSAVNNDPGPGNVTTLTKSTTVVASNCWVFMGGSCDNSGPFTGGAGATVRFAAPTTETGAFDSNGTVTPGAYSMTYNGSSGHYTMAMASFKPAVSANNGNLLKFF